MKKLQIPLALGLLLSLGCNGNIDKEPIKLTSKALVVVDGTAIMNAEVIGLMLKVRRELKRLLFGEEDAQHAFVGCFEYDGHMYSIRQFTLLENDLHKKLYAAEQRLLEQHKGRHTEEWQSLERSFDEEFKKIKDALCEVKNMLDSKLNPFIEQASGSKDIMLILIEESMQKRLRKDSFLLNWGRSKEGQETEIFHSEVTTFQMLDDFCTDLTDFLTDLINSCPKAKKQFVIYTKKERVKKLVSELVDEIEGEKNLSIGTEKRHIVGESVASLVDTDENILSSPIKAEERDYIKKIVINKLLEK